ncbi:thiamine-phosphate kinase [Ferrovibrio terrae]|uniref:Thiamine-monophosphate kinase n=1 Tax=Ferrovibrio terrae TaxID=2594003 RepID=A0A516H4S1_9PROT|nr:thiamine-phosphate kinase [Ferrovibrio terrae]QDO98784.1 thiamine-phosphate kinase [Ferrovibrio terrae]
MPAQTGLGEFDLIARYLAPLSTAAPGAFNLRDDAALLPVQPGEELVVTTDAMIEGVHFLAKDGAERIARKLLRVNLSDLAAKGAKPIGYQLILGLPGTPDETWLTQFCSGLRRDQEAFGFPLYGGDTVRSPGGIILGVTAFGSLPAGSMLRRSGAQSGDDLYVTGSIGDAALGLETKLNHRLFSSAAMLFFDSRLHIPTPRLALGQGLRGLAHAALDVSDGLVQDAGHLAAQSNLMAVIEAAAVPLSLATRQVVQDDPDLLDVVLTGGDDYELLFAVSPSRASQIAALSRSVGLAATRIGRLESGQGVVVQDQSGSPLTLNRTGFQHFGGS